MFRKKQQVYKITIVENGSTQTFECTTEKAKNQYLYDIIAKYERLWSWEQWQNSPYKTFDKWFKEYIKPQWKESDLQSFRINKKLILIKKI